MERMRAATISCFGSILSVCWLPCVCGTANSSDVSRTRNGSILPDRDIPSAFAATPQNHNGRAPIDELLLESSLGYGAYETEVGESIQESTGTYVTLDQRAHTTYPPGATILQGGVLRTQGGRTTPVPSAPPAYGLFAA